MLDYPLVAPVLRPSVRVIGGRRGRGPGARESGTGTLPRVLAALPDLGLTGPRETG
jgi:hypothetical protein